jgi:hypothetical protein
MGEDGILRLVAGRVGVGDVVTDDVEIRLIGLDPRYGGDERLLHGCCLLLAGVGATGLDGTKRNGTERNGRAEGTMNRRGVLGT